MIDTRPLVSVVIPCFNHAAFVAETIESVINQDYARIELVVIDDGSSDNSVAVIQPWVDACEKRFERFAFFARENRGVAVTLNEGLAWCRGAFVCPMASDDVMLSNKVSRQLAEFAACDGSVAGVYGGEIVIDAEGQVIRERDYPRCVYRFEDVFLRYAFLSAPSAMFRLEALRAIGYRPGLVVEDWFMSLRLLADGKVFLNTGELLVKKRLHQQNVSWQYEAIWQCSVNILEDYRDHPLYSKALARVMVAQMFYYLKTDKFEALRWFWRAWRTDVGLPFDRRLLKTAYLRFFK
ncbi:glycosyltransferase [Thiomicrospira microaerophila]|uniref:glycosyltransferase family 2 protein n=1 Tax=Thiomicrospira microaerophila TaxID=406020 RepID=UPI0020106DE0|nr:glycosyltransferase [Thiomicrospira microaerophila]UQB42412.1 glycosyltransferase [Thiomicrospira microaerophila]